MSQVVIVMNKGWGNTEDKDYEAFAHMLIRLLTNPTTKTADAPVLEVETVANTEEALGKLGGRGTVIYISRGMLAEAREIKAKHPSLKVVLFTGAFPEEEIILLDKTWFLDARTLQRIVG